MDEALAYLLRSLNARVVLTLVLAIGLWLLVRWMAGAINRRVADPERRYALRKMASYSVLFLFAFLVTAIWLRQLTGFSTVLGLVGAGIAVSLQEVITAIAGWVLVTWSRSYRVGDRVELGGIQGDVIDVGLIRTTLMETGGWVDADQQTGRIVTISNSYALRQPVFNYSAYFPFLWDGLRIPVTYDSDWELAHRIVSEELANYHARIAHEAAATLALMRQSFYLTSSEAQPGVYIRFNDNWIEISARYLVRTRERRRVSSELSQAVLTRFSAESRVDVASETLSIIKFPRHAGRNDGAAPEGGPVEPEG